MGVLCTSSITTCISCVCRTEVGRVWSELSARDPSLLEHFERFLTGVTAELKQSQHDKEKLETHMKRCVQSLHSHVMPVIMSFIRHRV